MAQNQKTNKVIIGFIGDHNAGKTCAANILEKHGFYKVSITNKVKEFISFLLKDISAEEKEKSIPIVREKGYKINSCFWLNLVLTSIDDDKDNIVFDDISMHEVKYSIVTPYQIYRKGVSLSIIPNIQIIENNLELKDFEEKIVKKFVK